MSTLFVFIVFILGLLYSDFTEISIIFIDIQYIFAFFVKLLGFFIGPCESDQTLSLCRRSSFRMVDCRRFNKTNHCHLVPGQEEQINSTIEGSQDIFPWSPCLILSKSHGLELILLKQLQMLLVSNLVRTTMFSG